MVSEVMPHPAPPQGGTPPSLQLGLQILRTESRKRVREHARLGDEFVCVGFYPPICKRIQSSLKKFNSVKIRPLGRQQK